MDISFHLRHCGRRVVGQPRELVSLSFAYRQLKKRQADDARWQERKARFEARRLERLLRARDSGRVERMRALGWHEEAAQLEREIAEIQ